MNDKANEALLAWVEGIGEAARGAKDFAIEQAPAVVHDVIALGRAEMTAQLVLALLVFCPAAWWAAQHARACRECGHSGKTDDVFEHGAIATIFVFVAAIAALVFLDGIHEFCAAWFAPRVYVIEYVADLIGAMKN